MAIAKKPRTRDRLEKMFISRFVIKDPSVLEL
jgi:hypothetical protein